MINIAKPKKIKMRAKINSWLAALARNAQKLADADAMTKDELDDIKNLVTRMTWRETKKEAR